MLYKDYTKEIIGFKDVKVTFGEIEGNNLHIHIEMQRRIHKCPRCAHETNKIHDYRIQKIKDIPSFGNYTYIHLRKRRYISATKSKSLNETPMESEISKDSETGYFMLWLECTHKNGR